MNRIARIALFLLVFGLFYIPFVRTYGIGLIPENSDDFPSYYFGAQLAFDSGVSPYVARNWRTVPIEYAGDNGEFYPFLYPPPSLLLFRPFTFLDYPVARAAMLLLNHILILAIVALMIFGLLGAKLVDPASWLAVAYTFSFFPLFQTMDKGQTNLILLLLLVLTWVALKRPNGSLLAGASVALAILLKLTPAVLLVPMLLRRQRAAVLWTLVTLAAMIALSLVLLPRGIWDSWFTEVGSKGFAQRIGGLNLSTPANQSLNALVNRTFYGRNVRFDAIVSSSLPWVAKAVIYVLSGSVLAITLLATYLSSRRRSSPAVDLELSAWILVSFLVSPISWDHHLVLLLPCLVVLLNHLIEGRAAIPVILALMALGIFLALPYPSNAPAFREGFKTLLISMQLYAVCALWILNVILLLRSRAADVEEQTVR